MIGVLITNNGTHPADKWAEVTASHIVQIADHVSGEKRGAAIKLQAAIIDILEGHHAAVRDGERAKISDDGHARLQADLDPSHHVTVDEIVSEIIAATVGTPWEADFANPEMPGHIAALLNSHFATSMQIERSWHADRNADTTEAVAFKETFHPGA